MTPLRPTLRAFEIARPPSTEMNGFPWDPSDLIDGGGVAVAFRLFDIVGWDITTGRVRWRIVEEGQIARWASRRELPFARREGCRLAPVVLRAGACGGGTFVSYTCLMSADGAFGIRRLRLEDGGVSWTVSLEDLPVPAGGLPFPIGVDPMSETCAVRTTGCGNTLIVSMVYSGSTEVMLTHLIGLNVESGRIMWDLAIEHERAIVDQHHDFSGHWVREGQLESVNPADGSVTVTALGLHAGVRCDPAQVVEGDVFVPWFWKGKRGLVRVRDGVVIDGFDWADKEQPGRVVDAGGRLYWSGNRTVRPLGPGGAWAYKPGSYVYGVEGVPGGPLWVLSDGAGGALDRLDADSGDLESRFRPPRRGVGSYMRVGDSDVLAISVLRTRSERSGDVMLVDMRSGETAWLGQPALLAARRRAGGYVWIVHPDGLQLVAIDPVGVRGAGRS